MKKNNNEILVNTKKDKFIDHIHSHVVNHLL